MRRKLGLLIFALGITAVCLGGVVSPAAQAASCTYHCYLPDCGDECCVLSDCTIHCFHVVCGN
jgi:hypothetical protein